MVKQLTEVLVNINDIMNGIVDLDSYDTVDVSPQQSRDDDEKDDTFNNDGNMIVIVASDIDKDEYDRISEPLSTRDIQEDNEKDDVYDRISEQVPKQDEEGGQRIDHDEPYTAEPPESIDYNNEKLLEIVTQSTTRSQNPIQQQQQQPEISTFIDHFTLTIPSSTIRYRDSRSAARVVQGQDVQFVLEETYDDNNNNDDDDDDEHNNNNNNNNKRKVEIRQIYDSAEGVHLLRFLYVLVTAFWTGYLFVFCLHMLLFLALDLSINLGITNKEDANLGKAIGSILGFAPLVYSLASSLVIAEAFIKDTWRGHQLIRNFAMKNYGTVAVEWTFFSFFLGIPIVIMCIMLLTGSQDWWQVTLLVWFSCVVFFYTLFTVNVILYEFATCGIIMKNLYSINQYIWFNVLYRCLLLRQTHTYSGLKIESYLAKGVIVDTEYTDKGGSSRVNQISDTVETEIGYYTKTTLWKAIRNDNGCLRLYEDKQSNPERIYSIDDARDVRPFITYDTWGLEKIFCRSHHSRYIAIVNGPGALTIEQLRSSIVCSVFGTFLVFFVLTSALIYVGIGTIGTIFGIVCGLIIAYPRVRSTYKLYKTFKGLLAYNKNTIEEGFMDGVPITSITAGGAELETSISKLSQHSEGVYYVKEVYRISKPTQLFCILMLVIEFSAFFVYPLVSILRNDNIPLAMFYIVAVGVSALRYYINASVILEETGHMDLVGGSTISARWKKQSRFNEIVGNITGNRTVWAWVSVLGFVGFAFLLLMCGAVSTNSAALTNVPPKVLVNDFEYIQKDSLRYPTCQLSSDLGASPLTKMADYAYLAGLAYYDIDKTQAELDGWFAGKAVDEEELVKNFRESRNTTSAVSFKLITFPDIRSNKSFAYVSIRGTINAWDALTDAQLWSAAALMQIHRAILPVGFMWTPIIFQLLRVLNKAESQAIEKVSFYKDTGDFVDFLLNQTVLLNQTGVNATSGENTTTTVNTATALYSGVAVTGHSLGGGLSIITGAQKGVPAVALSGPNAMLSRKSFDPPILREALDKKTFNIIPERDLVPMIDDRAQNFQEIRCMAKFQDVVGCHSAVRSLCEIIYTCGSSGRPIPCECVTKFGYPEPTPKQGVNTTNFTQACDTRRQQLNLTAR